MDDLTQAESQAEREERLRHGSSFGAAAAAYAEHRPGYAEAAVRWALEPVSVSSGGRTLFPPQTPPLTGGSPLRVLDLGAGTGKLTAILAGLGAEVTAVEPDPDMLAELRRDPIFSPKPTLVSSPKPTLVSSPKPTLVSSPKPTLGSVRSLPGSAEEIPLPDASVDAVLAGQALHWFDLDRAMPEIARVLTPGGVLAALWNVDDDRTGWVATLAQISKGKSNVTLRRWQDGVARTRQERLIAAGSGLLGTPEVGEFENGQRQTVDSLLATIATHSNFLVMEEPDRTRLLAQVGDFLRACPETGAGEFVFPIVTVVLRATRK